MPFEFNDMVPEVYVSDFETSMHFYVEVLGFTVEYTRETPKFAFLSYHGSQLMLQQVEPIDNHTGELEYPFGRGVNFQIHTPDARALAEALKAHGYALRKDVEDYWRLIVGGARSGSREFQVLDPDGYYLRFAEELGERPADST